MSRATLAGLVVLVAALALAWLIRIRGDDIQPGACRGCNVLVVTIDTLRADRVGAYGSSTGLTPTLDDLAARGIRFELARTSAPLTLPAHASLLTGVSPPAHGLRTNSLERLGGDLPTLATVLGKAGYRTGAFVSAFVLDARYGLNRGFEEYDDRYGERRGADDPERVAEAVAAPALQWIEQVAASGRPWFAWVHFYDPHAPYAAPAEYTGGRAPYDAEVAYVDATLGRMLGGLAAAGRLDRTLIVATADHGESLGDHGERTHGVFAYEATLRVPLIFTVPGVRPRVVTGAVRLIDVAPTTLELVGVPAPAMEGRSLLPRIGGRDGASPPAYFEALDANRTRNWAPLSGVVDGDIKFIELPLPELYDLAVDPDERENLYRRRPDLARRLESSFRDIVSTQTPFARAPAPLILTAEARERLRALGYVAGTPAPARLRYTDDDDPKRLIESANALDDAVAAARGGDRAAAVAAARAIIARTPRFASAYGTLAAMLRDEGRLGDAIRVIEDAVRRDVADPSLVAVLGGYLQESGDLQRSAAVLEALVQSAPDYLEARNSLGVTYARQGRADDARALFEDVLKRDPTSAAAHDNLGALLLSQGKFREAVPHLEAAVALDGGLASAFNALGVARARLGDGAGAVEAWHRAVDLDVRQFDALYNLGLHLLNTGRREEATEYLKRFAATAPPRYAADIRRVRELLTR